MGCFAAALGLMLPRFVLVVMWLAGRWIQNTFDHWLIPLLGIFFLPYTLLWFLVVMNFYHAQWGLWQILFMVVAVIADLSSVARRRLGRKKTDKK